MYPVPRLLWQLWRHRRGPALPPFGVHVSQHRCWPWDIDPWGELNNGRTLTLYDLGRIPLARRTGLIAAMRRNGWGLAMAGGSVRWRRRVRAFERIEMRSRLVGWDARFLYLEQEMRVRGESASHLLARGAVTRPGGRGLVPPAEVAAALGLDPAPPPMPPWVEAWIAADDQRPWPPELAARPAPGRAAA